MWVANWAPPPNISANHVTAHTYERSIWSTAYQYKIPNIALQYNYTYTQSECFVVSSQPQCWVFLESLFLVRRSELLTHVQNQSVSPPPALTHNPSPPPPPHTTPPTSCPHTQLLTTSCPHTHKVHKHKRAQFSPHMQPPHKTHPTQITLHTKFYSC